MGMGGAAAQPTGTPALRPVPMFTHAYHGFGLHWLDLSGNRLQDSGAAAVVRALVHNQTVLALDLSANAIGKVRAGCVWSVFVQLRPVLLLTLWVSRDHRERNSWRRCAALVAC